MCTKIKLIPFKIQCISYISTKDNLGGKLK